MRGTAGRERGRGSRSIPSIARSTGALFALALLLPCGIARATGMTDTVTVLPPVNVTGTRSLDGGRATTTTLRLDRAKLTRFQPATANDALVALPGVDLVKTGPWASRVSVRGLGGDRVLLLVDGVKVNGVRGHGGQASLVSVDKLDAVEVQPGASGAQYGSDALGGVVQFNTHRSLVDGHPGGQFSVQTRASSPDAGWGLSSKLRVFGPRGGFEVAGGADGLGALVTPEERVPTSGYREKNLSGRGVLQLGRTLIDYEHTWSAAYDVGLPAFGDTLGSHGSYPLQARDVDRLELTRPGSGAWPDARVLGALLDGHSEFDETTVSKIGVLRPRGYSIVDAWDKVQTRSYSVQPSVQWPRFAGLRLAGEYRLETSSGPRTTITTTKNTQWTTTNVQAGIGESMPHATRESGAASALVAPAWKGTRLELGARYDHFFSRADSTAISTTPELDQTDERASADAGLSHRFGAFEPYAHLATGFRVPNLEERYYHDEIHGGMVVFGNPDLNPETSRSAELGLRLNELGALGNARVSAYRSNVDDLITIKYAETLYGRPQFQYQNVKQARIEGLEAQAQLKARRVVLGLYGTLPRARDAETGKKLTDAGTARATFDLSFPVPRVIPAGMLSVRVRWNDAVTGVDSTLARPAFSTTSLELSSFWAGVRASVAIKNLWNHTYREPLSFIDEPGRTVAFSLRRDVALGLPFMRKKD